MTRKVIEKEIKKLIEVTPAVIKQETVTSYETIYECDKCGTETNSVTTCLGCGKDFCFTCIDHYHSSEEMKHQQFVIGDYDLDTDTPTKDYKLADLYLCGLCQECPPEKLKNLLSNISHLRNMYKQEYIMKNIIIDEIKQLEKENALD